jgi:hypothetical protein
VAQVVRVLALPKKPKKQEILILNQQNKAKTTTKNQE